MHDPHLLCALAGLAGQLAEATAQLTPEPPALALRADLLGATMALADARRHLAAAAAQASVPALAAPRP